jgi:hypothetical protein
MLTWPSSPSLARSFTQRQTLFGQHNCKVSISKTALFSPPTSTFSSSWLWKSILKSQHFISKSACNIIHSSSSLPIWSSSWIPTIPAFSPSPSLLLSLPLPNLLVSDIFCYDPHSSSFSWNSPLLHSLLTLAESKF